MSAPTSIVRIPPDIAEVLQLMLRMDERGRNTVLIMARSQAAYCETPLESKRCPVIDLDNFRCAIG